MNSSSRRVAATVIGIFFALAVSLSLLRWHYAASRPVFAARPHVVLHLPVQYRYAPPQGETIEEAIPQNILLLRVASFIMGLFGPSYLSIMGTQLVFFALLVLCLAAVGGYYGGPRAALWTGCIAAFMPGSFEAALGFDDHVFNMALTALAVLFLAISSFRRLLPVVFSGLLAGLILHDSLVPSNGALAVLAMLFAAGGMGLEALLDRRQKEGVLSPAPGIAKVAWKWLAGAILFLAALALVARREGTLSYISYIFSASGVAETQAPAVGPLALLAYPYLLVTRQLGPILSFVLLAGFVGLFAKGCRGRWTLSAWFLGLVLLLSVTSKRNPYYDFCAMIAAAPIAGVGVSSLCRGRVAALLGFLAVLGVMTFTTLKITVLPPDLSPHAMLEYFQDQPQRILRPPHRGPDPYRKEAQALLQVLYSRRKAREPLVVLVVGTDSTASRLRYFMTMRDPSVRFFVVSQTAKQVPESARPFFLSPRPMEGSREPDLEELLRRDLRIIADPLEGYRDITGRVELLERALKRRDKYREVLKTRHFRLFDDEEESEND